MYVYVYMYIYAATEDLLREFAVLLCEYTHTHSHTHSLTHTHTENLLRKVAARFINQKLFKAFTTWASVLYVYDDDDPSLEAQGGAITPRCPSVTTPRPSPVSLKAPFSRAASTSREAFKAEQESKFLGGFSRAGSARGQLDDRVGRDDKVLIALAEIKATVSTCQMSIEDLSQRFSRFERERGGDRPDRQTERPPSQLQFAHRRPAEDAQNGVQKAGDARQGEREGGSGTSGDGKESKDKGRSLAQALPLASRPRRLRQKPWNSFVREDSPAKVSSMTLFHRQQSTPPKEDASMYASAPAVSAAVGVIDVMPGQEAPSLTWDERGGAGEEGGGGADRDSRFYPKIRASEPCIERSLLVRGSLPSSGGSEVDGMPKWWSKSLLFNHPADDPQMPSQSQGTAPMGMRHTMHGAELLKHSLPVNRATWGRDQRHYNAEQELGSSNPPSHVQYSSARFSDLGAEIPNVGHGPSPFQFRRTLSWADGRRGSPPSSVYERPIFLSHSQQQLRPGSQGAVTVGEPSVPSALEYFFREIHVPDAGSGGVGGADVGSNLGQEREEERNYKDYGRREGRGGRGGVGSSGFEMHMDSLQPHPFANPSITSVRRTALKP